MIRIGQIVAGYRIEEVLGQGGMGIVYKAYDPNLHRWIAIKLIKPELSEDPAFRRRFDRERKAHANLEHPNIVDIRSSGETDEGLYLTMRFIDGPNLSQLLVHGPLSPDRAMRILFPIGKALDFAHRKGTIHRDLKPQNVLISSEARPYLTDFGLAWAPDQSRVTTTGVFMGTVAYASPEQLQGAPTSAVSDIYSFACVLFECLTGDVPFPRDSHLATAFAHAADERPRPSATNPALPPMIDEIVAKGMAIEPSERFSSAGQLMDATAEVLGVGRAVPKDGRDSDVVGNQEAPPPAIRAGLPNWLLGAGIAVFAAVGFALGHAGDASGTKLTSTASSSQLSLMFPDNWRLVSSGPAPVGVDLEEPLFLRERGGGTTLSAGMVETGGKFLLSRKLLHRLKFRPQQDEAIRMGEAEGYRYPDLRLEGGTQPFDSYVLPTSDGVVTVTCRHSDGEGASSCARIAGSISLRGSHLYALGPSPGYGRILSRALSVLSDRVKAGRRDFDDADVPAAQAAAANDLGRAFSGAAEKLAGIEITPQSAPMNLAVAAALRRAEAAYRQLAAAANAEDPVGYDQARRKVYRAERELSRTLRRLEPLGYRPG